MLLPIIILPGVMFTILLLLPFVEAWITGDKRNHHLLERPRNAPTRTATMVALMTFYGLLWAAGGNDIIAITFDLSINQITYFMRGAVFIGPVIAFIITRRWCISLQRHDSDRSCCTATRPASSCAPPRVATPSGTCRSRTPGPTCSPPATATRSSTATARRPDANGLPAKHTRINALRNRLRRRCTPTTSRSRPVEELEEGHAHAEHEHELQAGLDHSADGHQFDGHHLVEDESLRSH